MKNLTSTEILAAEKRVDACFRSLHIKKPTHYYDSRGVMDISAVAVIAIAARIKRELPLLGL